MRIERDGTRDCYFYVVIIYSVVNSTLLSKSYNTHTHTHNFDFKNHSSRLDQMDMTGLSKEMGFLEENFLVLWGLLEGSSRDL